MPLRSFLSSLFRIPLVPLGPVPPSASLPGPGVFNSPFIILKFSLTLAPVFPRQLRSNKSFPKKNVAIPIDNPPPNFPLFSLFLAPATTTDFLVQKNESHLNPSPPFSRASSICCILCSTVWRIESAALICRIFARSSIFWTCPATVTGGCSVLRTEGIQKGPPPLFAFDPQVAGPTGLRTISG
ncbi:hypothetical protein B0T16DRAFT_131672 [Cercophora newfieldiana]|uniref:Uncharacterized protein n=1 Tax=Cercophora newfieldiana TaxID=92897 RepID=A0AA39YBA7_9PEZI|nr:hypothetical protein B0T16DRAFT_131672 [Cercophora newfieldiana]